MVTDLRNDQAETNNNKTYESHQQETQEHTKP